MHNNNTFMDKMREKLMDKLKVRKEEWLIDEDKDFSNGLHKLDAILADEDKDFSTSSRFFYKISLNYLY